MYPAVNRDPARVRGSRAIRRAPRSEPAPRVRVRSALLLGCVAGSLGAEGDVRRAAAPAARPAPRRRSNAAPPVELHLRTGSDAGPLFAKPRIEVIGGFVVTVLHRVRRRAIGSGMQLAKTEPVFPSRQSRLAQSPPSSVQQWVSRSSGCGAEPVRGAIDPRSCR